MKTNKSLESTMKRNKDDDDRDDHDDHDEENGKPRKKPHDYGCAPVAEGACIPVTPGSKPKQSRRRKLDHLLANIRVPSVLGASFFHLTRRYLAGKKPANEVERRAFARFRQLPKELHRVLACALDSFDSVPKGEKERLFASGATDNVNRPLDLTQLTQAFAEEIAANVSLQLFGNPNSLLEERPGKMRTPPFPGGEFPGATVFVWLINGLRTASFRPPVAPGEYNPDELQQNCHVVLEGDEPKQACEIQTTNCPGHDVGNLCLRVQEIEAGKAVLLEGANFSSVDTKIRLTDVATFTIVRDVDAHVSGDEETPLTETIDGVDTLINDSRVHDRLSFRLPDDLPPGLYDFQVMVPNEGGDPGWGNTLFSDGLRYIMVIPPSTARFQIVSETLHCKSQTNGEWGSDEVGIKIFTVPLFPDLTIGPVHEVNGGQPIRFGDVDSGETRTMDHLLFSHTQQILGLALSVRGFEIDGEEAFEKEIEGFTEAFVDIMKDQIDYLKENWEKVKDIVSGLAGLGWAGLIAGAIAVAVVLAIDVIVALWAPADSIIEDALGPTFSNLVQLTSVNFPLPMPSEHSTPQGIRVKVTPLEKIPQQYRERREYISDDESSSYEIVYRYNRLA
jgi:hypothetical protein